MLEYEYSIGHSLEKKWGRMNFGKLSNLLPERFTVYVNSKPYPSRTIDKGGRVWTGEKAFEGFRPEDKLLIRIDNDTVYITKKRSIIHNY